MLMKLISAAAAGGGVAAAARQPDCKRVKVCEAARPLDAS